MKIESRQLCILTAAFTLCFIRASAHEQPVHREIAQPLNGVWKIVEF